jgi:hypothetical protein
MPLKPQPLPSIEVLEATFVLTDSGRLINKIGRTSRKLGAYADDNYRREYRTVYVAGKLRFAHRVIWKMVHGTEPEYLDHINGDPTDNRPRNLRAATHSENMMNAKVHRQSASGVKGVHLRKDNGQWRAYLSKDGKRKSLGQFPTIEQAQSAMTEARKIIHGEFCKL